MAISPVPIESADNRSPTLRMVLHPLTLAFNEECRDLEGAFITQYTQSSLKQLRFALGIGFFLYAVFGVLDYIMVPELTHRFWAIRYLLVCPSILAIIVLSYSPIFKQIMQPALAVLIFIASGGIIAMIMIGPLVINQSYHTGLILVLILGYSVVRARFIWASFSCCTVVAIYLVLSATSGYLPLTIVVANNFFIVASNLLGMLASYNLEFYARRDYFMSHLLQIERKKVITNNQELERTIEKRTAMLASANEELRHEIQAHQQLGQEKKQLEDQLRQAQKMEAIGTLAGGIAHDFNNILAAIMGHAELTLINMDHKAKAEKYIAEVLHASDRAKDLVSQILSFSRQSDSELKPIQISIIVKEALRLIRATLPTTISISTQIRDQDSIVVGNATQIHQILMNLCTNAAHAMEPSGGQLSITLSKHDIEANPSQKAWESPVNLGPGRYIELIVADTGQGIHASLLDRIFDPYFTTKEKGVGTGLGLAVVHGIVQNHGGAIQVQSDSGIGTKFFVYLPRIESKLKQEIKKLQAIPKGNEKVLFIDDDEALAELGSKLLTTLGYRVTTYTESQRALEQFMANPTYFDLMITDLIMPGLTGEKLAMEILKRRPDMPIIVSTGFRGRMSEERLNDIGIKGILYKPITIYHLATVIRQALEGTSASEQKDRIAVEHQGQPG